MGIGRSRFHYDTILKMSKTSLFCLVLWTTVLSSPGAQPPPDTSASATGQVLQVYSNYFILQTEADAFPVMTNTVHAPSPVSLGDRVRTEGRLEDDSMGCRIFRPSRYQILAHGVLPPPRLVTTSQVTGGEVDFNFVEIEGVISAARVDDADNHWNWLSLRTSGGTLVVATHRNTFGIQDLTPLVDAGVRVRGIVTPSLSHVRYPLRTHLLVNGNHDIQVTEPPPADPFSAPAFTAANVLHRQTTTGTVIASTRSEIFLRRPNGSLVRARPSGERPTFAPGTRLTISGFFKDVPSLAIGVLFRPESGARLPPEPAATIDPKDVYLRPTGLRRIDTGFNGRILVVDGIVRNISQPPAPTGLVQLECGGWLFTVDLSGLAPETTSDVREGAGLRVTGLCLTEFQQSDEEIDFPHFAGVSIVPRTPADIVLLRSAPWWTPVKLIAVIVLLLLILIVALAWTWSLKVLSVRRGQALYREELDHALAEQKVEERTRLAIELHDSLSQTLTGVALQLEAAEQFTERDSSAARGFLATAGQMLASCRQELRCCLQDLRCRTFEEKDMTEAIQHTLARHLGTAHADIRFNVPRERFSESTAHAVLKIIRELVVNAIRHGRATQIRVAGEYHDGTVSFSVTDNGRGFDPTSAPGPAQGHFGIQGIRERLGDLNGQMTIDSAPNQGTRIRVRIETPPPRETD